MDVGSIVSNALGALIGGLALLLLVEVGKRIRRIVKQRAAKPKDVLDNTLRGSQEYQQILSDRKSYRLIGYMCLFTLLALLATIIVIFVQTRKINLGIEWIGFLLLLLGEIPLAFYVGYSPISSQEVERKRQQNRAKTFHQAHGAKPYSYIFFYIIFPSIFWFYGIFCFICLILLFAFPSPFHVSMP